MLVCGVLCLLAACGPGVEGNLGPEETPGTSTEPPIPRLGSVDGELGDVDGRELRVRVLGRGFVPSSTVMVGYQPVPTTFVSDTELLGLPRMETLTWDEHDTVHIQVRTPGPGGGTSTSEPLPYPGPELLAFTPDAFESLPPHPVRVTVTGRNFVTGSAFFFSSNPVLLPTTVLSPGSAEIEIPTWTGSSVSGTHELWLWTPGPRGRISNQLSIGVYDPIPEIEGVWPTALSANPLHSQSDGGGVLPDAGAPLPVPLRILGRGLRGSTRAKWNGQLLESVQPVPGDELRVYIPREALTTASIASLTLETPGPTGGESAPFLIPVTTQPVLEELSPQQVSMRADAGDSPVVLSLTAGGVGSEGVISWNGSPLGTYSNPPDLEGGKRLELVIPASQLLQPGTHFVTVRRGSDGAVSGALPVQVVGGAPAPVAGHLLPPSLTAGVTRKRLQVIGQGFTSRSIIRLDGQERVTERASDGQVSTWLEPADLVVAGVRVVTVHTPGPGGGTSLPLLLNVVAHRQVPELGSMSPVGAVATADASLLLSLWGSGVGPFTVVRWNGEELPSSLEPDCCGGSGRLTVSLPAHLLAHPGVARVTLFNPAPGGGTSEALFFVIRERGTPDLRPERHFIEVGSDGDRAFYLDGPRTPETRLTVDGQPRVPFHIDGNRYTLRLSTEDVATPRTLEIRAVTPGQPPSAPAFLHVTRPLPPGVHELCLGVVSTGEWPSGQPRGLALSASNVASRSRSEPAPINPTRYGTLDWNGTAHPLEDFNGYRVWLAGEDVARPGPLMMTASRTAHGGTTSPPVILNVVAERPRPLLTAVQPATVRVGSAAQRLRLTVSGLHPSSVVHWEGQALPTREWWAPWSNGARLMRREPWGARHERMGLEAVVPATAFHAPGLYRVTVVTPGPGGGTSLPLSVLVE